VGVATAQISCWACGRRAIDAHILFISNFQKNNLAQQLAFADLHSCPSRSTVCEVWVPHCGELCVRHGVPCGRKARTKGNDCRRRARLSWWLVKSTHGQTLLTSEVSKGQPHTAVSSCQLAQLLDVCSLQGRTSRNTSPAVCACANNKTTRTTTLRDHRSIAYR
jgi:hypothetical protein